MNTNPRQALEFHCSLDYGLIAYIYKNDKLVGDIEIFEKTSPIPNDNLTDSGFTIIVYYDDKYIENKADTIYEALDLANDWWFHQQRKEQMGII